ncbi:YcaO-like family protein [Haloimpatiens sp. FM7330]|uniref:YcaO-like family protein n=1 Tax=Haloimpatiens sp. FM7330 TaxID=3298610 RepID=UPI003627B896
MSVLSKRKYKDEIPINTINRIRKILGELGLVTVEKNWKNSAEGFYSVRVTVGDTDIGTNGKGTTQEYALASAYGELMERLQNFAPFRLSRDLSPKALKYKGFYYAPDEKNISIDEFINNEEEWTKMQLGRIRADTSLNELIKKWLSISYEEVPSDFVALPYININSREISYIPIKMICKMYMSNGMCAGNSTEEAIVQGISEICERVVNKEIIKNKITPPTVPLKYIQKFPRIFNMIERLESSGNYKVIVKDCSLGKEYPVVAVILIDRDNQTYFIKFGSHLAAEIALERTLTELLQGQDIKKMMGVKEFSYKSRVKDEEENLIGILANGSGYYPTEFFSEKFSYEFKGFKEIKYSTNKEIMNYLIKLLDKKGYSILVRNVSYLGFPSYHIIVPGLSEIEDFDDIESLNRYSEYNKMKGYIRNLYTLSESKIDELIDYLVNINYASAASIIQFLDLPIKNVFPWYYMNVDLFISALCYKKGDFDRAYKFFDKYLRYMECNYQYELYNKQMMTYYKCVRDYIGTRCDKLSEKETTETLSNFYPPMVVKDVMMNFGYKDRIFKQYGQLRCWNCKNCELKYKCSYNSTERVYKVLKDKYSEWTGSVL